MSEIVLETKNLGIAFGGLKAVENLNIRIEEKQIYGLIGPNGAGKTTAFNMLTGVYKPTSGTIGLCGEDITGLSAIQINRKGMARTFQNIRLFNNMSVIRNVLVGMHNQKEYRCNFFESVFRLPKHFRVEKAMRDRAKELLRALESGAPVRTVRVAADDQISITSMENDALRRKLESLAIETMTPIEAMNALFELKKML